MNNSAIIQRWFSEVWNQGNEDVIDELIAADCCIENLDANTICSPNEMKAFFRNMNAALTEIHIDVDQIMKNENRVAAIFTVNAKHAATATQVSFKNAFFAEFEDVKVVKADNVVDFLTMFIQARVLPPNALLQGLSSNKIS